jgi:hypothetical protein
MVAILICAQFYDKGCSHIVIGSICWLQFVCPQGCNWLQFCLCTVYGK